MVQPSIEFQFHGEADESLARDLSDLLSQDFAGWTQHTTRRTTAPGVEQRADPIAIAVLILTVPPALLATWDLAQRIQVKEKLDRLISWARGKSSAAPATQITVHLPTGAVIPLEGVKPEDLLDALAGLADKSAE